MNESSTRERLYNLLPAIYRVRDEAQGGSLRALLAIIEDELQLVAEDIENLYNNWFIETCAEWVVPYIGDLLGVRGLHAVGSEAYTLRPYVANTLAYRRRKGTAAVLEQLAKDVTGWPGRAVEFFQLLSTTQHLNHLRPENLRTPDLRRTDQLELLGSPFERAAHTAEVRRIASARGRYNIPNIGLFLWRLQNYIITRSNASAVTSLPAGCYRFNPLGYDSPLFNRPETEAEITHLAEEINVPGKLRRRPLYEELEARRKALVEDKTPVAVYFDEKRPVLQVFVDGQEVPPEEILICDLSDPPDPAPADWRRPPDIKSYPKIDKSVDPPVLVQIDQPIRLAVDPELGRLVFPAGVAPGDVQVSFSYGFSSDLGGGPYDRQRSVEQQLNFLDREATWQMGVTQDQNTFNSAPDPSQLVKTIQEAVTAWNNHAQGNPNAFGIITIMDSGTYSESLTGQNVINIPAGARLAIVAADWPVVDVPEVPGQKQRIIGHLTPDGLRPHLRGDLSVVGAAGNSEPGELMLNGILIEGMVKVLVGDLGSLHIAHCTLVPAIGGLKVNTSAVDKYKQNDSLCVKVVRSICGSIDLADSEARLEMADSIINTAIHARRSDVVIQTSTVFGRTETCKLEAGNSIFTEIISVEQRQTGCVRFCFAPEGSRVPRRYRCQSVLVPIFTSTAYGNPEYGQLHLHCPKQIFTGAEDGSEMGAFNHLKQPQREANLRASLDEYLRFGLEAGIFYVT